MNFPDGKEGSCIAINGSMDTSQALFHVRNAFIRVTKKVTIPAESESPLIVWSKELRLMTVDALTVDKQSDPKIPGRTVSKVQCKVQVPPTFFQAYSALKVYEDRL